MWSTVFAMAFLCSASDRTMPDGGHIMILLLLFVQGRIVPSAKRRSLRRFMVNPIFSWNIVIGHNLLSFQRCRVASCACMRNYPRLSTMFVARMQQMGDMLPSPVPDPQHPGHYATWLQMAYDATLPTKADEHQPTALLNGHGACAQCRWVFTSKGDKAHHNRLRHPASGELHDE